MNFLKKHFESIAWLLALLAPVFIDPTVHHYSFCFFKNIGLSWCSGCGLGQSIALLYRGQFVESFNAHPLGVVAVIILLHRIYTLLLTSSKQTLHEPKIN